MVIGGGSIATHKIEKLLPFVNKISVVAPELLPRLEELERSGKLEITRRKFKPEDISSADLVIIAVDDLNLQAEIYDLCKERNLLCKRRGQRRLL